MATLKKLMTLLSLEGLTDQRAEIINAFTHGRTSSAKELNPVEIAELCAILDKNTIAIDQRRKRLIAVIFGTFAKVNKKVSMEYVLAIACRASGKGNFNQIPPARLDSLYNAFLNAQKDFGFSKRLVEGFINEQISYN